ncbi:MAG: S-layer homology domain-containing protein [Oscillospiraceae bacterium]|nr:S-layer homology domain-containing protein [Oscillospiraceae bacterium]
MKNLKKVLSMALALAMALSLMTTAFAANPKASDLTGYDKLGTGYTEAVDVMVALGVINGVSGDVQAQGNVTREQAAKIVCTMLMGSDASQLSTTASYFSDVPASRWSAPYIAYCVEKGIVSGVGGGKFNPTGNVTGNQFAKMLLVALGYKADIEGYTGTNWAVNVSSDATDAGIFKGAAGISKNEAATREQACLYAFNTLLATTVKYTSNGTSITIGGANINVGASEAIPVTEAGSISLNATKTYNSVTTVEFGEKYFPKLALSTEYAQGNVVRSFDYKGAAVTTAGLSGTVLATSTNGTSYENLTTATKSTYIGYKANDDVTYVYQDGVVNTSYPVSDTLANNISTVKGYIAKGVIVNFIDTNNDSKYDVVSIVKKSVAKLAAAPTTRTSGAVSYVTIPGVTGELLSTAISYPSGLAKKDVVLYYASQDGTTYVEKAASVAGTITAYADGTSKVTVDGAAYGISTLPGAPSTLDTYAEIKATIGSAGYTFYLDNGNNICYTVAPDATATLTNTWFISAVDASQSFGAYSYKAIAVDQKGAVQTITVKKTSTNGGTMTALSTSSDDTVATASMADGKLAPALFYTYAANSDGSYNLTVAATQNTYATDLTKGLSNTTLDANDTSYIMSGNKANFLTPVTAGGSTWTGAATGTAVTTLATASTVFLYYDSTNKSYTAYTGITNAQSYAAGGTFYVLSTNGYATLVIAKGATSSSSVSAYDKVFLTGGATVTKDANSALIYTYTAIVNGEIGKSYSTYSSGLNAGVLYFAKEYNTSGVAASGSEKTSADIGSTVAAYTVLKPTEFAAGAITANAFMANGTTVTITKNDASTASFILGADAPIYLYNVHDVTAPVVMQISAEQAAALTYDAVGDTITTVATSSTDPTVAAVYIYVNADV